MTYIPNDDIYSVLEAVASGAGDAAVSSFDATADDAGAFLVGNTSLIGSVPAGLS